MSAFRKALTALQSLKCPECGPDGTILEGEVPEPCDTCKGTGIKQDADPGINQVLAMFLDYATEQFSNFGAILGKGPEEQ